MAKSQSNSPEPEQPPTVKPSTYDPERAGATPAQSRALLAGAYFDDEPKDGDL
ncbi:hypothetical protein ACFQHV_01170 [Promicromonospora thailandica]|uniref:Uncharacterized protein n=1 Tax=Promicromonospora thailandica TaxID=765201 RepID=A0A9X2G4D0_9MICO|nr:hypothetical protein [Promicromonospora thailandica]MCP2265535.1 hypothetical protein [Promicromonospora thailandica]BFF17101.1 hypothetical protein GCM10025730_06220 [Promicromonospora thailandica]